MEHESQVTATIFPQTESSLYVVVKIQDITVRFREKKSRIWKLEHVAQPTKINIFFVLKLNLYFRR